jgi:hypothetical protein
MTGRLTWAARNIHGPFCNDIDALMAQSCSVIPFPITAISDASSNSPSTSPHILPSAPPAVYC